MRSRYIVRRCFAIATLALMCCAGACAASAPTTTASPAMMAPAPLVIQLRVDADLRLAATLENTSDTPLAAVVDELLQPAELVLVGPSAPVAPVAPAGRVVPFDTRTTQKYDNTIHPGSFVTIAPGASVALGSGRAQTPDGGPAHIQWGPFLFEDLAPGTYRAHVLWRSLLTTYVDAAGTRHVRPDAWTGMASSPEVELTIPRRVAHPGDPG